MNKEEEQRIVKGIDCSNDEQEGQQETTVREEEGLRRESEERAKGKGEERSRRVYRMWRAIRRRMRKRGERRRRESRGERRRSEREKERS